MQVLQIFPSRFLSFKLSVTVLVILQARFGGQFLDWKGRTSVLFPSWASISSEEPLTFVCSHVRARVNNPMFSFGFD